MKLFLGIVFWLAIVMAVFSAGLAAVMVYELYIGSCAGGCPEGIGLVFSLYLFGGAALFAALVAGVCDLVRRRMA